MVGAIQNIERGGNEAIDASAHSACLYTFTKSLMESVRNCDAGCWMKAKLRPICSHITLHDKDMDVAEGGRLDPRAISPHSLSLSSSTGAFLQLDIIGLGMMSRVKGSGRKDLDSL